VIVSGRRVEVILVDPGYLCCSLELASSFLASGLRGDPERNPDTNIIRKKIANLAFLFVSSDYKTILAEKRLNDILPALDKITHFDLPSLAHHIDNSTIANTGPKNMPR
jgi:hypothetical protein